MNTHSATPTTGTDSMSHSSALFNEPPHKRGLAALRQVLTCITLGFCIGGSALAQSGSFTTIDEDSTGWVMDLATDANGRIIAVGQKQLNGVPTPAISVSPDGGVTWTDHFYDHGAEGYTVVATGRRIIPPASPDEPETHEDSIVVAGNMADRWMVRRSTDGGVTWVVVDEYRDPLSSWQPEIHAAAVDSEGNTYIAATSRITVATRKGTTIHWAWLVRKIGRDGTKTNIQFPDAGGAVSSAYGITCVGTTVYVAGNFGNRAQVRRSDNGGASWTIVDNYRYDESRTSYAVGIASDHNGTIYVAGAASHAPKKGNTPVTVSPLFRKGTGAVGSFTTDTRLITQSGWSDAYSVAVDSGGNVHLTGQLRVITDGVQTWHWYTKRLDAVSKTWAATDGQQGGPRRLAADSFGNTYWAGFSELNDVFSGWLIRRFQ